MAADYSEGLARRTPTVAGNLVRRTTAAATFVAPTAGLALGEHLAWGGNPLWMINPPASWGSGRIAVDIAASLGAAAVGYAAARGVNKAIKNRQTATIGLDE